MINWEAADIREKIKESHSENYEGLAVSVHDGIKKIRTVYADGTISKTP